MDPVKSFFLKRQAKKIRIFPNKYQWKQFFKNCSRKEKLLLKFFIFLIFVSIIFLFGCRTIIHSAKIPQIGGVYREGVVGKPHYINPVLANYNPTDQDLCQLIYSGLLKYDAQGNLVNDLASNYKILDNGKIYQVTLKKDIYWHDGQKITADDVVFTIKTIQNSAYRSPLYFNWQGVEVEKKDNQTVIFKLKNKYVHFLNNLTVGIIPEHIWKNISPNEFLVSQFNLQPIGSGPFKLSSVNTDSSQGRIISISLIANPKYYQPIYLKKIIFYFYQNESALIAAAKNGQIDAFSLANPNQIKQINNQRYRLIRIKVPYYFGVFFNQQDKLLQDKNFRLAIKYATNKKEIISKVLNGYATIVNSPIPPIINGYQPLDNTSPDIDQAKKLLSKIRKTTHRKKNSDQSQEPIKITLTTVNRPNLINTAKILKNQWERLGLKVEIKNYSIQNIEDIIKKRDFQILLFGEALTLDPDPFSFWDSSQINFPGNNISGYDNPKVDKILRQARTESNLADRIKEYQDFRKIVVQDAPAIFLYSPDYLYWVSKKFHGVNVQKCNSAANRFSQVNQWYKYTQLK